jgi:hypothetical protein
LASSAAANFCWSCSNSRLAIAMRFVLEEMAFSTQPNGYGERIEWILCDR